MLFYFFIKIHHHTRELFVFLCTLEHLLETTFQRHFCYSFFEKCVKQHYFCYINRFLLPSLLVSLKYISLTYTVLEFISFILVFVVKVATATVESNHLNVFGVNLLHEKTNVIICFCRCCTMCKICNIFSISMQVVFLTQQMAF